MQIKPNTCDVLILGACAGLIVGLVEGSCLLAVFGYGWLNANVRSGVSPDIIWISAFVNMALFVGISVVAALAQRILQFGGIARLLASLFVFLACVDWLGLPGRLSPLAVLTMAAALVVTFDKWYNKHGSNTLIRVRRAFPLVIAAPILCLIAVKGGYSLGERRTDATLPSSRIGSPNVLVVVVDTLRADHLSLYGYGRPTSPRLDTMAKEGVVFENAVAPSSWTLPSHASMLTGRYPHQHGVDHEVALGPAYPLLTEVLQRNGFRTGGFSANSFYFSRRTGLSRGFSHFEDYFYSAGDMFFRTFWGRVINRYAPNITLFDELPKRKRGAEVNRELLSWIDRDRSKPFFAFINYFDIHEPYLPLEPYRRMFRDVQGQTPAPAVTIDGQIDQKQNPYLFKLSRMSPEVFQQQIDSYDGAIYYVDEQIAKLMSELDTRGLTQNTLVIITADHGECFGEHGLLTHWNALYSELIHVPLIYYWPGTIPRSVRINRPVSGASLASTVLDVIGIKPDVDFPVRSLAPLWQEPNADPGLPDPLAEMGQNLDIPPRYPARHGWLKAIVGPRWHLIISESLPPELYDRAADPRELHNKANDGEQQTVEKMSSRLWDEVSPQLPKSGGQQTMTKQIRNSFK